MARIMLRPSIANQAIQHDRHTAPAISENKPAEIWSTLLDNVAINENLLQKNLIILGGRREDQNALIESLAQQPPRRPTPKTRGSDRAKARKTPASNDIAIGYTYQNVYDSDNEDLQARLSIYTLSECSSAYAPLLSRLLTADSISDTSLAILLDWNEPWTFARTLCAWLRLLREVVQSLPASAVQGLEANKSKWHRARDEASASSILDAPTSLPLGPGEFDEPLGFPAVVVCHDAQAIERLEKEQGYREARFDYIQQFLRTILLKHGVGLIYTMPSFPGELQLLIHRLLDIGHEAILGERLGVKRADKQIRYNVVDVDRVLIPPGWDTWTKIKMLKESFDTESLSKTHSAELADAQRDSTMIAQYETAIQDPRPPRKTPQGLEVEHLPDQTFLTTQLARLEALRVKDEETLATQRRSETTRQTTEPVDRVALTEQLGPVQFNVGGIHYDADEAVRQLRERTYRTTQTETPSRDAAGTPVRLVDSTTTTPSRLQGSASKEMPLESLEAYFSSLKKGGAGSASASSANSPRGKPSPRTAT